MPPKFWHKLQPVVTAAHFLHHFEPPPILSNLEEYETCDDILTACTEMSAPLHDDPAVSGPIAAFNSNLQRVLELPLQEVSTKELWDGLTSEAQALVERMSVHVGDAVLVDWSYRSTENDGNAAEGKAPRPSTPSRTLGTKNPPTPIGTSGSSYFVRDMGLLIHVWRDTRAARAFHTGWSRMWQSLLEFHIEGLHCPFSAMYSIHGTYVSATVLPPLSKAPPKEFDPDPAERCTSYMGYMARQLRAALHVSGLPAGVGGAGGAAAKLTPAVDTYSMLFYPGKDGRFYLLSLRGILRHKLQLFPERYVHEQLLFNRALAKAEGTIDQFLVKVAIPNALDALLDAMKTKGINNAPKLVTEGTLRTTMNDFGINLIFFFEMQRQAADRALAIGEKDTETATLLVEIVTACKIEMVARTLKTFMRHDMNNLAKEGRSKDEDRLDAINRVAGLVAGKDPAFWAEHVMPCVNKKFRAPQGYTITPAEVHLGATFKKISQKLGCDFSMEAKRFDRFSSINPPMLAWVKPPLVIMCVGTEQLKPHITSIWKHALVFPTTNARQRAYLGKAVVATVMGNTGKKLVGDLFESSKKAVDADAGMEQTRLSLLAAESTPAIFQDAYNLRIGNLGLEGADAAMLLRSLLLSPEMTRNVASPESFEVFGCIVESLAKCSGWLDVSYHRPLLDRLRALEMVIPTMKSDTLKSYCDLVQQVATAQATAAIAPYLEVVVRSLQQSRLDECLAYQRKISKTALAAAIRQYGRTNVKTFPPALLLARAIAGLHGDQTGPVHLLLKTADEMLAPADISNSMSQRNLFPDSYRKAVISAIEELYSVCSQEEKDILFMFARAAETKAMVQAREVAEGRAGLETTESVARRALENAEDEAFVMDIVSPYRVTDTVADEVHGRIALRKEEPQERQALWLLMKREECEATCHTTLAGHYHQENEMRELIKKDFEEQGYKLSAAEFHAKIFSRIAIEFEKTETDAREELSLACESLLTAAVNSLQPIVEWIQARDQARIDFCLNETSRRSIGVGREASLSVTLTFFAEHLTTRHRIEREDESIRRGLLAFLELGFLEHIEEPKGRRVAWRDQTVSREVIKAQDAATAGKNEIWGRQLTDFVAIKLLIQQTLEASRKRAEIRAKLLLSDMGAVEGSEEANRQSLVYEEQRGFGAIFSQWSTFRRFAQRLYEQRVGVETDEYNERRSTLATESTIRTYLRDQLMTMAASGKSLEQRRVDLEKNLERSARTAIDSNELLVRKKLRLAESQEKELILAEFKRRERKGTDAPPTAVPNHRSSFAPEPTSPILYKGHSGLHTPPPEEGSRRRREDIYAEASELRAQLQLKPGALQASPSSPGARKPPIHLQPVSDASPQRIRAAGGVPPHPFELERRPAQRHLLLVPSTEFKTATAGAIQKLQQSPSRTS